MKLSLGDKTEIIENTNLFAPYQLLTRIRKWPIKWHQYFEKTSIEYETNASHAIVSVLIFPIYIISCRNP